MICFSVLQGKRPLKNINCKIWFFWLINIYDFSILIHFILQLFFIREVFACMCSIKLIWCMRPRSPFQLISLNVKHFAYFIWIWCDVHIFLHEQNVIDFMFAPNTISPIFVMDSRQIMEVFRSSLINSDHFKIKNRWENDAKFHDISNEAEKSILSIVNRAAFLPDLMEYQAHSLIVVEPPFLCPSH